MASLAHPAAQQPKEVAISMGGGSQGGSVEARLGSAAAAENDRFIAGEGNRQQLLLRCPHERVMMTRGLFRQPCLLLRQAVRQH